jgi:stage IV sporulation protein B
MKHLEIFIKRIMAVILIIINILSFIYLNIFFSIPGDIILIKGEKYVCSFKSPFPFNIKADKTGMIKYNEGKTGILSILPEKNGSVKLDMKLLGLLPLKTLKVDIISNRKLAACGNTVGVKIYLEGVLIIGISEIESVDGKIVLPTKNTGLKPGDIIISAGGYNITCAEELIDVIEKSRGKPVQFRYKSGDVIAITEVVPVKASDDSKYHLGLWVRDSTAGIGTLTFYDCRTKAFGALGHGITDIDTGILMPILKGEILEAEILGIETGKEGYPGELKGIFVENGNRLGDIKINSEYGIYGNLEESAVKRVTYKEYPIGLRSDIKEGYALILSNIDGRKVEEYEIFIQKVSRQSLTGSKGMIIKITDKRLLNRTGGIVQGMSGSPIIQDGRIIGAVTHVLVNDPTRGYGIFIDGMVKNIPGNKSENILKAG